MGDEVGRYGICGVSQGSIVGVKRLEVRVDPDNANVTSTSHNMHGTGRVCHAKSISSLNSNGQWTRMKDEEGFASRDDEQRRQDAFYP